jgi:hypothetical protein
MKRRDLFKMTGALAALPGAARQAEAATESASWKPQVLNAHQNATVVVLTDLIIPDTDTPGAKAANINRYIDLFASEATAAQQQQLISGLGWLDTYANQKHGHSFVNCSNAEQIALLETLDANRDPALNTGHQFFQMMKGMTTQFYYNTALGFRELNKGGRVPSTFACKHGGHA